MSSTILQSLDKVPLYPVADYIDKLPPSIVQRGGYLAPMYQREAIWMSFSASSGAAMKISVGGINAITGLPKDHDVEAESMQQDYICSSQPWLDGVCTSPRVVRQFVSVTIDDGYTIEGMVLPIECSTFESAKTSLPPPLRTQSNSLAR